MLLLPTHALGYAKRLAYAESFIPNSCTRNLQVGTYIMYSPALPDENSYAITFRSASRGTLSCGDAYEPGEDLEIHMALPSNHETVFDLFGGAKFYYGHCSPESDANGNGNNPGVRGTSIRTSGSTGTNYIKLSTPADGAEISVVAAYGKNSNQVWVTEPCTLVGGPAAVSPSPSPPPPSPSPSPPPPSPAPSPPPPIPPGRAIKAGKIEVEVSQGQG